MADRTHIEWTATVHADGSITPGATWNPTVGCSIISAGCTNCYAMKMAGRLEMMGQPIYQGHTTKTKAGYVWNGHVAASNWGQVLKPLSWKKPRRIFVNSMSDLFHEDIPVELIDQVFAVMALCPQHTFQVLTKRFARMRDYCQTYDVRRADSLGRMVLDLGYDGPLEALRWPLPNVWLGASVEDQHAADYRIPALLETPAAVRFLSCEPLLGPVRLHDLSSNKRTIDSLRGESWEWRAEGVRHDLKRGNAHVDWVIAGGESGPKRRPIDLAWMRTLRDQCAAADVPFFGKQIDKIIPLPPDLMVRQFPQVQK